MELAIEELSAGNCLLEAISAQLDRDGGLLLLLRRSGQINAQSVGDLTVGQQGIRGKAI